MHAIITFSAWPLFFGALLSDWAYKTTPQPQWINFSSWLIAGALVLIGIALLCALVDALRRRDGWVSLLLLLATFVLGFINALVHARDASATMPTGFILSVVVVLIAALAGGVGFVGWRRRFA